MADYFGSKVKEAVDARKVPLSQIDEHAAEVLNGEFMSGVVELPPQKSVVDAANGLEVAQRLEEKSIVLLKNNQSVLPIDPAMTHSIGHGGRETGSAPKRSLNDN